MLPSGWLEAWATSTLAARAATHVRIIAPWLTMATVLAPAAHPGHESAVLRELGRARLRAAGRGRVRGRPYGRYAVGELVWC
ncbi:hypothetical protein [Streptomyces sp. NPDC016845]|uniref:hypothetical protein n=1 Tax=Streptomyces sp. NPDC016845 TaxID=3364972 RepID=UPI003789CC9D